jgi:hypothetical protein
MVLRYSGPGYGAAASIASRASPIVAALAIIGSRIGAPTRVHMPVYAPPYATVTKQPLRET